MKKTATLWVIAVSLTVSRAFAAGYPKAYDAWSEVTSAEGKVTKTHEGSDGKGHVRRDVGAMSFGQILLEDYPNNKMISIMPGDKMYLKMPLEQSEQISNLESAEQKKAKSLGTKTIDGHPCHGFLYKNSLGSSEYWIGDDIDHVVLSELTTDKGKIVLRLKSFSNNAPAGDLMAIPAGYKEMQIPHF